MKILVTGADGQLGWELIRQAGSFGIEVKPSVRSELDITDRNQTGSGLSDSVPDMVINAAAYTKVDQAETDQENAFAVNQKGPGNLAAFCSARNIPLIHISTDFVFDGEKQRPYIETDPVSPLSVYGKSKAAGEQAVRAGSDKHIIVRTSWLYGVHGDNFVKTMLRLGREREEIRVVADQHGSPTSAADLAGALLKIALHVRDHGDAEWGTYHYCGKGITTWSGFAEAAFSTAKIYGYGKTPRVEPITTSEYPTPARRPTFSSLDCSLVQRNFGISPLPWQDSLKDIISRIMC